MSHDESARCLCVSEHRPGVLEYEWHHVLPLAMGGEDTPPGVLDGNGVWLCPTAHANVHEILRAFLRYGPLTWGEALATWDRPMNRYAYDLAMRGYQEVVTQQGVALA